MNIRASILCVLSTATIFSCNNSNNNNIQEDSINLISTNSDMKTYEKGTFGYDVNFLKTYDSALIVLKSVNDSSQIVISPKYQGKIFTSSAEGLQGKSFGWVNYSTFDKPLDPHMNGYGGENRMWLGPEGGKISLFFKPNTKQVFDNWHTPAAIDNEAWKLISKDSTKVTMQKETQLQNYAGTQLNILIDRDVELLTSENISKDLNIDLQNIKAVGFKTINSISNTGKTEWNEKTGAPCIWMLDMLMPSEKCVIVIPYKENASGKVATTDYFGEIPGDRIKYANGILYFKADGKSRGKLGIPPARVKNIAGSFDGVNNVLTITKFDIDNNGKYLNQEWRTDRDPYSGDAMNAYNDGPLEDGTQMGPFYEIESVSPAAFLKPSQKLTHQHNVYHFTGSRTSLDNIAKKLLGVTLEEIEKAFK